MVVSSLAPFHLASDIWPFGAPSWHVHRQARPQNGYPPPSPPPPPAFSPTLPPLLSLAFALGYNILFAVAGSGLPLPPRNYPWSLYAVFQTTITQWAFVIDCVLFVCFYFALSDAGYYVVKDAGDEDARRQKWQRTLLWALFAGHWVFSKTIKLVPHLLRNPGDVRFVPVSVLFGYFHNLIKMYGCMTVTEVRCRGPAPR